VRQVFFACEETQKRTPLLCDMVADCPAQHWVLGFESVQHGREGDWTHDFERDLAADVGEGSQVLRE
jgi:hypothetical protein